MDTGRAFDFCIPTPAAAVPSGPDWLHEVKYDGYRLRLGRDGTRVRLITRGGYNWSDACYPRVRPRGLRELGAGPLAAMRLKWTVRRNVNNEYFVDEMIGENLACTVAGPMAKEAAVKFVDDREAEARRRFEQLRSEMMGMPLMGPEL